MRDGLGLKLAQNAGLKVGILSGRGNSALEVRARELGFDALIMDRPDKDAAFTEFLRQHGAAPERVAENNMLNQATRRRFHGPTKKKKKKKKWRIAKMRRSVDLYIYVADVDAYHAEVVQRGVHVHEPLTTQWWGDRNFQVKDPAGYLIWISQTVAEFTPPAGVTVV